MLEVAISPSLEKKANDLAIALIGFDRQVAQIDGATVFHIGDVDVIDVTDSIELLTAA